MKIMQLTELQMYLLRQSLDNSTRVLSEIRRKPLKGDKLAQMKLLEDAVSGLEMTLLGAEVKGGK